MPLAKGDLALLEKYLAEGGQSRFSIAAGARAFVLSAPDDTGAQRERFRLVSMPKGSYLLEAAEAGRWVSSRVSGPLKNVVAELVKRAAPKA